MEKEFDQKKYISDFRKKTKKQFNTDLNINEFDEITSFLNSKNISKADFIRTAFKDLKKGRYTMKINELYEINTSNKKAGLLLNSNVDCDFYDNYFSNDLSWLLENKQKIENDFTTNLEKLKFDIILNSDLDERCNLINSLKNVSIEEFSNYINHLPFNTLNIKDQKETQLIFDEFKSIKDDYLSIQYFNSICRK